MSKRKFKYATTCYILLAVILNIVFLFLFSGNINITTSSLVPVAVIFAMLFQGLIIFSKDSTTTDTAYASDDLARLSYTEQSDLYRILRKTFLLSVPFCIPFIFFFKTYVKLLSILVYFLSFILGGIVFKLKNNRKIKGRIMQEMFELEEQKKKEELGSP